MLNMTQQPTLLCYIYKQYIWLTRRHRISTTSASNYCSLFCFVLFLIHPSTKSLASPVIHNAMLLVWQKDSSMIHLTVRCQTTSILVVFWRFWVVEANHSCLPHVPLALSLCVLPAVCHSLTRCQRTTPWAFRTWTTSLPTN